MHKLKLLFLSCPTLQTPMEDGKRETAVSMLPIVPEDSDTGRTYTCRVLNLAAPAGRQISVTINVQRECSRISHSSTGCFLAVRTHLILFRLTES